MRKELLMITEKDLEKLPEPVKKWLINTGVLGKKRIKSVSLSQNGKMKLNPKQNKWYSSTAKQYIRVDEPEFKWNVKVSIAPFINVNGEDIFRMGKGDLKMSLFSLIPIAHVKDNEKTNESSLSRFLLELPWYPTAALEDYVEWESIDTKSAFCKMKFKDLEATGTFHFDSEGNLLKVESMRYKDNSPDAEKIPCFGEIKEMVQVDGIKIPSKINVTWVTKGEQFTWYQTENFNFAFSYQEHQE
jgi:hypothetical protein